MNNSKKHNSIRHKLHTIIFEADTPTGKLFDVVLIVTILLSVLVVMLDSIAELKLQYGNLFFTLEWVFTILFSIEYLLRLYSVSKPIKYAASFYGVIDLLAVLPTYFSLILPGSQYLLVIRILRVLRIFRVLKFVQFVAEAQLLGKALRASRKKITVFLFTVFTLVIIFGSLMYLIEGEENGFKNILHSIYWAIVTLTTVGYGDISPQTPLGRTLASVIMILGYGIIAVPTGIVTAELAVVKRESTQACPSCSREGHDEDAEYCKYCGEKL
ncbi:MAG: ion transporter [Ignavibacteria bacterium]|jgi:voltage-gated potassium channel